MAPDTSLQRRWARLAGLFILAVFCGSANPAVAKPARCLTTDDGSFSCRFRATAQDGSFEISAPGKPTYRLNIVEPGVAYGFENFGSRNIALPGRYLWSPGEAGCWINDSTSAKICAR